MASLETKLKKDGWEVRKSKVDGGCYEVYGTDPQGRRVEAYFHPVSFKMLVTAAAVNCFTRRTRRRQGAVRMAAPLLSDGGAGQRAAAP